MGLAPMYRNLKMGLPSPANHKTLPLNRVSCPHCRHVPHPNCRLHLPDPHCRRHPAWLRRPELAPLLLPVLWISSYTPPLTQHPSHLRPLHLPAASRQQQESVARIPTPSSRTSRRRHHFLQQHTAHGTISATPSSGSKEEGTVTVTLTETDASSSC